MNNDFGRGVPDDVHHRVLVAQVDGHHCDRPQELYSPIIASGPNDGYHFVTLEAGLPSHGCADEARRARDKDSHPPFNHVREATPRVAAVGDSSQNGYHAYIRRVEDMDTGR